MKAVINLTIIVILLQAIQACKHPDLDSDHKFGYANVTQREIPLFEGEINDEIYQITISVSDTGEACKLQSVCLYLNENSETGFLDNISIRHIEKLNENVKEERFGDTVLFSNEKVTVKGLANFTPGDHNLIFDFYVKREAQLEQSFAIEKIELGFNQKENLCFNINGDFRYRPAKVLRKSGQDNCDTYRIPGLITTDKGTLIAVYDNRYNRSKDLQENIDIGMSRSTDGGHSWEPMKVIMDMDEWGGRPESLNGVGDPCILYDHNSGTIWVAALWMSGLTADDMLWWSSEPGMGPEETGQILLVKSMDDGVIWSDPINITNQIKDPEWQLLLQGPGRGITLKNGTLVFPAQFKADIGEKAIDGGKYTCHSTIIYSRDGGETWDIGTGAKSNTTEAQVVQLSNGSLMLNMRDDRNRRTKDERNGRAVSITDDMGKTWQKHKSSNSALPEPNCMASLIAANIMYEDEEKRILFFSNPDDKNVRANMTIKASLDEGLTWPDIHQVMLNEEEGYGYSCLTMIDDDRLGILYESIKELYFQVVPLKDLLPDYE